MNELITENANRIAVAQVYAILALARATAMNKDNPNEDDEKMLWKSIGMAEGYLRSMGYMSDGFDA